MFKITNELNESSGPYNPPTKKKDGPVIRNEKNETIYRITGAGELPAFNPSDPVRIHFA